MKPKHIARTSMFSAGLWLTYLVLRSVLGLGSIHALVLVVTGVLAWFFLYLLWALPSPDEPRWKFWLRIAAVICATLAVWALSLGASDNVNSVALVGFFVVVGIGTAWASRPIKHAG